MIIKTRIDLEVQGDFYVSYLREGRNTKGDKTALYFAKNASQVKKEEIESHGESVIVEKILPSDFKNYTCKDTGETLQQSLKREMKSENTVELPICVGVYF